MKIKTKAVQSHTYSIEDMTAAEAAAVCFLLGRANNLLANKCLATTTYDIYTQLFAALEASGDKVLMHAFMADQPPYTVVE